MKFKNIRHLCLLFLPILCFAHAPSYGKASYYGEEYRGRLMANKHPFDPDNYTCASWFYKLGTVVKVTNVKNHRSIVCEVTDRGPNKKYVRQGRIIDLSEAVFFELTDDRNAGLLDVKVKKVK